MRALDIAMLRTARSKNQIKDETLGSAIDSYEAQLNELQLTMQMLVSQTAIERQKAEVMANQIKAQLKVAEDKVVSFLNDYQKQMYDSIYSQVKVSESTLKFKGTDIYDLSFVSNFDYSQTVTVDDGAYLKQRPDRTEVYRSEMRNNKVEVDFAEGLCRMTADDDVMLPDLMNQRNYFMKEYYLSAIKFYQEVTIIGFLHNPTNNIQNLKEFIALNKENVQDQIDNANNKRLAMGEEAYKKEIERIRYIERMVVTAKARLKYLELAYAGKWTPPTFQTLTDYAEKNDLTYSKAVAELNQKSRQTLCIPDWVLGMAEMYNQIEIFEQGSNIVSLNPYDEKWIRKAKEVINLEAEGVRYTAQKLFKAIDCYWEALTYGFQDIEDYHLEKVIAKALSEDSSPIAGYMIATNYDFVDFSEDFTPSAKPSGMNGYDDDDFQEMGGLWKKIKRAVSSVAKSVGSLAKKITREVAKATKAVLDNTLGRVLPASIYDKISNITDVGLEIMKGNINNRTFRMAVKGVTDIALVGNRIYGELWRQASKVGAIRSLDKLTGGVLTSAANLNKVPITLGTGGKVDWKATAFDLLKVGAVVVGASGASSAFAYLESMATNIAVTKGSAEVARATGLDKTSLGRNLVTASAMIATGQSDFVTEATKGAEQIATNSVVNSTGLKDTKYGRTIAEIGVSSASSSIQSNTAFSQEFRDKAEDKMKEIVKKEADKKLKKVTGGLVDTDLLVKAGSEVYDFATGDKTIADILGEAKDNAVKAYDVAVKQYQNTTPEEVMNRVSAEADRFVRKEIDKRLPQLADKYGQELLDYLVAKYGPKSDYDNVIVPDDYLNYQIYAPTPTQRTVNTTYITKKSATPYAVGLLVAGGAVAFLSSQS